MNKKENSLNGKLNYLLVMPRFVTAVGEGYNFPLGIAYISSVMKQSGFNVFTVNLNHIHGDVKDILKTEIEKADIDVVMTGGLSFQYLNLKEIVDIVHTQYPSIKVVVGGGIITGDPQVAMTALEHVDVGCIGEGEATITELSAALENNVSLDNIKGIIFKNCTPPPIRTQEEYIITAPREEIKDLDALPYPDYEGFGLKTYLEFSPMGIVNVLKNKSFFMAGSRSCPYQCTFCFHTVGKKYRQRSIENVLAEVKYLRDNYGIEHIRMSDELFARDKTRVKTFLDRLKEWGITWAASFRVDDIDEELVEIMKSGTCLSMDFGIESADDKILKSMRKHITCEQIEKALKLVYDSGIAMTGNFIFGDIEETVESANKTLDWWETHKEYNLDLNFIVTYPGTYLYKYAIKEFIIKDPVQFLKDGCPQINVSKLSNEEMGELAKRILKISLNDGVKIENAKIVSLDPNGRMSLSGICSKCHKSDTWTNIKLFVGNNRFICKHCGQRYVGEITKELESKLINKIKELLDKNTKIAIWGLTSHVINMFDTEPLFKNDNIVFIDNASIKQLMKVNSKPVFDPSILSMNDIDTVICCYPNSIETVRLLCPPSVTKILSISELLY
ncbi:hypothetical protein AGMMS4957_05400 [Bacteroidia bacterium]|nr:hypothetical protein AGMMS4957_05400 [Bacteroidia bacterium]